MGRKKLELKKIEKERNREQTFSRRHANLLKKARELSVLCDAEVGVIVFSNTGQLHEFSNSSLSGTIDRYNSMKPSTSTSEPEVEMIMDEQVELELLRNEVATLTIENERLMGNNLGGASVQELHKLEQQMSVSLKSVETQKDVEMFNELERINRKERERAYENEVLRKEIDKLRRCIPLTQQPTQPADVASSSTKHDMIGPDTTLRLRPLGSIDHSETKEAAAELQVVPEATRRGVI